MDTTNPSELVKRLQLTPHPEGGWFREFFRSGCSVSPADGRGLRNSLTSIWFLLHEGESSAAHRVISDESWHWCGGFPLELSTADDKDGPWQSAILGPLQQDLSSLPVQVVAAGLWQKARPLGAWSLVSCTVGPGFDFRDFSM